jgi:hypothetical protein
VADLCNHFLTFKKGLLASGEIADRTFQEYSAVCQRLVTAFGKTRPITDLAGEDFQHLRERMGPRLGSCSRGQRNPAGQVGVQVRI